MPQVAEVFADLKFRVQGTGDVTASTRSVQRAMQEVQQAATSASAEVRVAGRELKASIDQVTAAARDAEAANAKIAAAGDTVESLGQQVQQAGTRLQGMRADMASLESQTQGVSRAMKEIDGETRAFIENMVQGGASTQALSSVVAQATGVSREAARAWAEQSKEIIKLKNDIESLKESMGEDAELLGTARGLGVDEALADMERQRRGLERTRKRAGDLSEGFDKVRGSSRSMNGALRLNQTTLRGLITSLRTGRASSSLFAGGLRAATAALSGLSVGVIAATVAVGGYVLAIGKLAFDIGRIAVQAALVPPEIHAISNEIGNLAGVTQSQLNRVLDESITKLQSLGAAAPEQAATAIARAGSTLQFLSPAPFDAEQSIAAVQQAVDSMNARPLEAFGINVVELNRELENMAEQGASRAERATFLLSEALAHADQNMRQVTEQAEREKNSIQGVASSFRQMIDALGNSEEVRAVFERIGTALRDILPNVIPVLERASRALLVVGNVIGWLIERVDQLTGAWDRFAAKFEETFIGEAWRRLTGGSFPGLVSLIEAIRDGEDAFGDFENEAKSTNDALTDIAEGDFTRGVEELEGIFDGIEDGADRAKTAVQEFSNTTSTMRGLEGALRSTGQAFADMNHVLDPGEVTDFVGNLAGMIDFIAQRGAANVRASLEAEADLLRDFFDMGLLSVEQYERGLEELEAKQAFADPLIRKVEEMERGFEDGKRAAENAASGVATITTEADTATGAVEGTHSALSSLDGIEVGANIHIGVTGPGLALLQGRSGFGGGIGGFDLVTGERVGQTRGGGTSSSGTGGITSALPGTPGGPPTRGFVPPSTRFAGDAGLIRRAKEVEADTISDALEEANRTRGITARSRGGGGGGGGGSQGASIEEIREFFRQVNAVIMSGIRGGKIFSTAGNAIPVGAPGEFLNTKGGALIQTVNIRGVWDFADPAAKRQIIKELEESLAGLKREVA